MSDAPCPTDRTSPAPAVAPAIREGRYYATRDGRTVGPIVPNRGEMGVFGDTRHYPWVVPAQSGFAAYSVDKTGRHHRGVDSYDDLMLDIAVDASAVALARMVAAIRTAIAEAEAAGISPAKIAETMLANDLIVVRWLRAAADPAPQASEAPAAAEAAAPATTERDPATIRDDDMLAVILEEARREAEAMLGRPAPTLIAIARMVGPGYPLGDAVAAIREADQMVFADLRGQAVDLLSEAIVALAVASVVIREGRE